MTTDLDAANFLLASLAFLVSAGAISYARRATKAAERSAKAVERATAALRAVLRLQLLAAGIRGLQVWDTFVVTGPTATKDTGGNTWFEWVRNGGTLSANPTIG